MFAFLKKLFGSTPVETPAPYKVETPEPKVEQFPFPAVNAEKKTASKKPAVKAKTARKPKTPKA